MASGFWQEGELRRYRGTVSTLGVTLALPRPGAKAGGRQAAGSATLQPRRPRESGRPD